MNWKEFFKPTKSKILIFLILTLISFYDYITGYLACVPSMSIYDTFIPIFLHPYNSLNVISYVNTKQKFYCISALQPKNFYFFVLDLIWYYLFTSLIYSLLIWIYDKVKKR